MNFLLRFGAAMVGAFALGYSLGAIGQAIIIFIVQVTG